MARYRDDGEVQIDNSTKVHFRNAFQQLIMIAALNVGTLLIAAENEAVAFEEVRAGMGPTCSRAEVTKLDIQSKTSNPKPRQKLFADRD